MVRPKKLPQGLAQRLAIVGSELLLEEMLADTPHLRAPGSNADLGDHDAELIPRQSQYGPSP